MNKQITIISIILILITGCSNGQTKDLAALNCCGTEVVAYAAEAAQTPAQPSAKATISQFSTVFDSLKSPRGKNIKKASDSINNKVVAPGEVFSYNTALGPTNKKNGYHLAGILVNGKKAKGYGGGVCQVSSTLFNAVEKAGLETVERHNHSKDIGYVPKGKDAATSYGVIDFKFKNTLNHPIKISSYIIEGNKVVVDILKA